MLLSILRLNQSVEQKDLRVEQRENALRQRLILCSHIDGALVDIGGRHGV
jgi:hypothetical protein